VGFPEQRTGIGVRHPSDLHICWERNHVNRDRIGLTRSLERIIANKLPKKSGATKLKLALLWVKRVALY